MIDLALWIVSFVIVLVAAWWLLGALVVLILGGALWLAGLLGDGK